MSNITAQFQYFQSQYFAAITRRVVVVFVLIYASVFLVACSGGGGGDGGSGDGDPLPSVVTGLDSRPANSTCLAPASPVSNPAVTLEPAFPALPDLDFPLGLFQAPGDPNNIYVILRAGQIVRFSDNPAAGAFTTVLDITSQIDTLNSEGGLLGMAFHPQFAANRTLYLSYTSAGPSRSVISRFTMMPNGMIDPASEQVILELAQPAGNHNGGAIAFSPVDGYLYIGFGDGGGFAQRVESQDTTNFYGAMLRINVNPLATSAPFYQIPHDNPFAGSSTQAEEIYAYGFRNPFRWSFDPATGALWVGDVGEGSREEIDIVENGGNYGWPLTEGFICGPSNGGCNPADFALPFYDYPRSDGGSITGGFVYRSSRLPGIDGAYIYGDYVSGSIWMLVDTGSGLNNTLIENISGSGRIVAFGQDHDGEVYILRAFGGAGENILRLTPDSGTGGGSSTIPTLLSATGCVDASSPQQPAEGLIPYDVIAPLWSDGATKERYIALPDSERIALDSSGDFLFPVGTVLVKHFIANNTYIETRLLMHHASGWAGYSYEWNSAQTDAELLDNAKDTTVAGLQWHFPSGSECRQCHTLPKNTVLGLETSQLDRLFLYPGSREANQLDTFDAIALFSNNLTTSMRSSRLAMLDDTTASLEQRAKSYLHSNCSQCHLPGGIGGGDMDLRYNTPLAAMNICGVAPAIDDLGISGAQRVAPGNPSLSILLERMHRLDGYRMPPLASAVVDGDAVMLVSDWIAGLSVCP